MTYTPKQEMITSVLKKQLLFLILFIVYLPSHAQTSISLFRTGPEQEACHAIELSCNPTFYTPVAYTGVADNVPANIPACRKEHYTYPHVYNPVFFKFKAAINGKFNFTVTPNPYDPAHPDWGMSDYDYYFVDITGKTPSCNWIDYISADGSNLKCNIFDGAGYTGACNAGYSPDCYKSLYERECEYDIIAGHEYLLLVSAFNDGVPAGVIPVAGAWFCPVGFTLNATNSTPGLFAPVNSNFTVAASPATICQGASSTLTTSSTLSDLTYAWTGSNLSSASGSPVTATPSSTTTYTVSATKLGSYCPPVSKDVTVTVIPPFNYSLTTTDTKICEGEYITVTAVGAPTGSTFSWSSTGHAANPPAPNPQSAVYTPSAPNHTISTTATAPGSPCTVTKNIFITVDQPFPVTLAAPVQNVCPGQSTTITATGLTSNTVFTWNGGSLVNSIGASKVVSPVTTTIYNVSAKDPANECTVNKQISIGVNPTPTLTVTGDLCNNSICVSTTPAVLAVGDIVIIRYRGDATDDLVFVPLVNLPASMTINFSDKGWNGTAFVNNTGDAMFTYTTPAAIAAGTPVTLSSAQYGFDLSDLGDQIFVFQGTEAAPVFIYAVNTTPWQTTGGVTATGSYLPSVLVKGYTASNFTFERENGKYCPVPGSANIVSGTRTSILYEIGDETKWMRSSSPTYSVSGDVVGINANWSFSVSAHTTNYAWNAGVSAPCFVNPPTGNHTVTYTDLHGCYTSTTHVVSPANKTPEWSTYFGDNFEIFDIKVSPVNGNLIICGSLHVTSDYVPAPVNPANVRNYGETSLTSHGGSDFKRVVVAEINKNGNEVVWVDYIGTKSWYTDPKLILDANGDVYVSMNYTVLNDYYPGLVKLNAQGILQWLVKDLFVSASSVTGVSVTSNAVYLLYTANCGSTYPAPVNTCQGLASAGVAKFSKATGSVQWTSFFGAPGASSPQTSGIDITNDNSGNIYFTTDAKYIPSHYSLNLLPPVSTYSTATVDPDGNPVVVKMNPSGAVVWWDLLSETAGENTYTPGIEVVGNNIYTTNYINDYPSPTQQIHRRNATTGSLLYTKSLPIDFSSTGADKRFIANDMVVDAYENVYLTGTTSTRTLGSVTVPGALSYNSGNTIPVLPTYSHGDAEIFVMSFRGANLNDQWYTYYGVDPSVTVRNSAGGYTYGYASFALDTDADGAVYFAGIATGDYDEFEIVNPPSGTVIEASNTAYEWKGIITKIVCGTGGQPQPRVSADNAETNAVTIAYPNPFTNNTFINVKGKEGERCEVTVYSLEGTLVYHQQNVTGGETIEVGEGFAAGMYFVQVRGDKETNTSVKIIKR